ncbi:hypothetical protein NEPTK9_001183, partial [Candidatus Neptunochlamydia vexilliferae]|nr:hypothetical protein [Candidatus Neptunochlamydia vexilliferae]MBF5059667.1 hypothetical protein [Candidatus Neptunochlamydia vexilliferae]
NSRAAKKKVAFEMLELCDGKLSRTVLRGGNQGNLVSLLFHFFLNNKPLIFLSLHT